MPYTMQQVPCITKLTLIHILLLFAIFTNLNVNCQQSDWLQSCGECQCTWKDGKKTAYCRSRGLRAIPDDLSSEVQVIDLFNNFIHYVEKENFLHANLPNLHKISLKNCSIESLHPNSFKGLAVLIELDLSNNLIDKLPNGIFNDLEKLRTLILSNNLIKVLPQYILSDLPSLSRVDLKNNNLKLVETNAFKNLSSLANIHLDNNQLSVLTKDTFSNLSKLIDLSLSSNPWNCSCELKDFKDFVIQKNLYTPSTKCSEPKSLEGLRWNEIKSGNFACKPYILYPQRNFSIDASGLNDVVLKCRVKGTPKVDLNWIHNNKVIYSSVWESEDLEKYRILNSNTRDYYNSITNEIQILNVSQNDYGEYICRVNNSGGETETNIFVTSTYATQKHGNHVASSTNSIAFISIVFILTAIAVVIIIFVICVYWRAQIRSKKNSYRKHPVLHSSVIVDMQGKTDLLEETAQLTNQDNSIEIIKKLDVSLTEEPNAKVNSYDYQHLSAEYQLDSALPPDLLSFPTYSTLRSIPKDSLSVQLPQEYVYGSTKENSPIYNRYISTPNPNYIRPANRVHSPFNQAPIIYSPLVVKQQYMTIPRKSRAQQWSYTSCSPTPSGVTSTSTRRQSTSDFIESEPVYDNLGLRTTAGGIGGNSTLSLQKTTPFKYSMSMKDRPLPETPMKDIGACSDNNFKIYEPINEIHTKGDKNTFITTKLPTKLPPKPPPKPAKRNFQAELNESKRIFDDEDENGTEV